MKRRLIGGALLGFVVAVSGCSTSSLTESQRSLCEADLPLLERFALENEFRSYTQWMLQEVGVGSEAAALSDLSVAAESGELTADDLAALRDLSDRYPTVQEMVGTYLGTEDGMGSCLELASFIDSLGGSADGETD